jgi:hypothetical protein
MIVLVLGPGRSGTSLVMQILEHCGFQCGDPNSLMSGDRFNPHGYYEHGRVVDINKRIISDTTTDTEVQEPGYVPTREAIEKLCGQYDMEKEDDLPWKHGKDCAVKDPRFCFTYPVWADYFRDKDVRVLIAVRDMEQTIRSWCKCYPSLADRVHEIIIERTNRIYEWVERYHLPHVKIFYDDWFIYPDKNVARIESIIGRRVPAGWNQLIDPQSESARRKKNRLRVSMYDCGWPSVIHAFAEGVQRFGHSVDVMELKDYQGPGKYDVAITIECGGLVRTIHQDMKRLGRTYLAIHDSYLMRRGKNRYYGVTRNGVYASGEHIPIHSAPSWRWTLLGQTLAPWRTKGKHILIADRPYKAENGCEDIEPWIRQALPILRNITKRPIKVRTHPAQKDSIKKFDLYRDAWIESGGRLNRIEYSNGSESPLEHDLLNAWTLITYNSNSSIDAVIAGIPVFTGHPMMVDPVGNKDLQYIEYPRMEDRQPWANWLAWCQWTEEEMRRGLPWMSLIESYDDWTENPKYNELRIR